MPNTYLLRNDARVTRAHLRVAQRQQRQARRPRIAETIERWRRARSGRFVTIEGPELGDDGSVSQSADGDNSLEHLREMVIHRILLERPRHRIVATERSEAAAGEERRVETVDARLSSSQELVNVRMRMPPIDVAFAVAAGAQFAAIDRETLEVERRDSAQPFPRRVRHDERLRDVSFGERVARRCRIGSGDERNRLGHGAHLASLGRTEDWN